MSIFLAQLSSSGQEVDDEMDEVDIEAELSTGITGRMKSDHRDHHKQHLTTAEQVDLLMDHCIEVESNERMRQENINRWTLCFKNPEMEAKVSLSWHSLKKDLLFA